MDPARNEAEPGPPSRLVAQPSQPSQPSMDGSQLVQCLSVQAGNMVGDLQHDVRELMVRVLDDNCRPCYRLYDLAVALTYIGRNMRNAGNST